MTTPHTETRASLPPPLTILSMIGNVRLAKAMHVATQLGIADILKDEALPITTLAHLTGMHEDALYRLLRALASIGIFREVEHGVFAGTDLSHYLGQTSPKPCAISCCTCSLQTNGTRGDTWITAYARGFLPIHMCMAWTRGPI